MKEKFSKKTNRVWLKWLIIAEIIVCYMAVLTIISYARGPEKFKAMTDSPMIGVGDFISFNGEAVPGDVLQIVNGTPGTVVGYSAWIALDDLDRVQISFQIDCLPEYAGNVLYVDLYELETGYDNAEQQVSVILQEGRNEVEFSLELGENHPQRAQLRFFTLDSADYTIRDISFLMLKLRPKVSVGIIAGAVVCFLLLAGTGRVWWREKSR